MGSSGGRIMDIPKLIDKEINYLQSFIVKISLSMITTKILNLI